MTMTGIGANSTPPVMTIFPSMDTRHHLSSGRIGRHPIRNSEKMPLVLVEDPAGMPYQFLDFCVTNFFVMAGFSFKSSPDLL